jgi:hypothetical protein
MCSSPPRNTVYARRVELSALAFSLSSHRHSYKVFYLALDLSFHNKQIVYLTPSPSHATRSHMHTDPSVIATSPSLCLTARLKYRCVYDSRTTSFKSTPSPYPVVPILLAHTCTQVHWLSQHSLTHAHRSIGYRKFPQPLADSRSHLHTAYIPHPHVPHLHVNSGPLVSCASDQTSCLRRDH